MSGSPLSNVHIQRPSPRPRCDEHATSIFHSPARRTLCFSCEREAQGRRPGRQLEARVRKATNQARTTSGSSTRRRQPRRYNTQRCSPAADMSRLQRGHGTARHRASLPEDTPRLVARPAPPEPGSGCLNAPSHHPTHHLTHAPQRTRHREPRRQHPGASPGDPADRRPSTAAGTPRHSAEARQRAHTLLCGRMTHTGRGARGPRTRPRQP